MSVPRITSQMIPTPGFSSSDNNDINTNANNQSLIKMESSNNMFAFPAFESTDVSQPMLQKQRVGQNSRILHNIGGHMGELRSTLQQKSYVPSNGPLDAGLGMMGNNMSLMKGPVASEGYLTGTLYGNSPKPLQQHFDQHQQSAMQGTYTFISLLSYYIRLSPNLFQTVEICRVLGNMKNVISLFPPTCILTSNNPLYR